LKAHWDSYWFGPIAAVRPFLFVRGVLLLLAFDLWLDMPDHAARYDVAGFNVSQLAILDLVYPIPTAGLYVCVVLLAGLFAFSGAFAGFTRPIAIATGVLYTFGWTMSMFDSYQHHYLLSIVLLGCALLPSTTAMAVFGSPLEERGKSAAGAKGAATKPAPRRWQERLETRAGIGFGATLVMCWLAFNLERSGWLIAAIAALGIVATLYVTFFSPQDGPRPTIGAWGYSFASVSIAIVYFYTGISKTEPNWRSGVALQNIAGEQLAPYQQWAESALGIDEATFHPLMGFGVIAVQWVVAIGYLLAPLRDRHWLFAIPGWIAFFGAMSFHLGAEYLGLEIGWFSWYMVMTACIFLLPGSALDAFGRILTWPGRAIAIAFPALEGVPRSGAGSAKPSDGEWGPGESHSRGRAGAAPSERAERRKPAAVKRSEGPRGKTKKKAKKARVAEHAPVVTTAPAPAAKPVSLMAVLPVGIGAMVIVPIAGLLLDLPGALVAGIGGAVALGGFVAWRILRHDGRGARPMIAAAAIAALAMWIAISVSDVRYDFYRRLGSQNRRQQHWEAAYEAYKRANRYAPEGESRERQMNEARERMEAERAAGGGGS
jgi:hypothetical protein